MLSIGAFSRLGHISVRMLRHYDALGLLPPAHIDADTGYRYYNWQQLETLGKIETLKAYRFPLSRIVELLQMDEATLNAALHEKRLALYREAAQLAQTLRRLDSSIGQMEDFIMSQSNLQAYQVTVMETQPQQIFGLCKHIHIGQVHDLFQDLRAEMASRGLTQAGPGIFIYHGEEFSYEDMDVEAAFPVNGSHPDTRTLAGGPYVATIHHGAYESVSGAYEAIAKYMDEHPEYEIAGPGFERYIIDEQDNVPPEEFQTGVLFPVRKIEA